MTMPPQSANNKPENLSTQPMGMYNGSLLYNPPELGFYFGWIAYHNPEMLDDILKEIGERTAEIALETFDVAIKAMGVREPPPEQRLELYRVKPPELWMEQQAKFPWRYEHDMQDWMKLEQEYPLTPPAPTLPEITGGDFYSNQPAPEKPKRSVKKVTRDERGRISQVEESEE